MRVTIGEPPGGERLSEDRVLVSAGRDLVVVLDGVSTVTDETPRGGWYAQTLGEGVLAAHARASLAEACADPATGPQRVVETIDAYEHTDPDGRAYPRYKTADDKALALAVFDPPC
ncbi:hypothetical protein [Kitasatospora sp. NPDC088783]|uniref:hypothetical protein n=1 Tax=Kitasatospora sp. NPDC088783 TaxID=3364077 RepID=UPI003808C19A